MLLCMMPFLFSKYLVCLRSRFTKDEEFGFLVKHIALENEQSKLGRDKLIRNYMEEIMIHMCRYIESQEKFKSM